MSPKDSKRPVSPPQPSREENALTAIIELSHAARTLALNLNSLLVDVTPIIRDVVKEYKEQSGDE